MIKTKLAIQPKPQSDKRTSVEVVDCFFEGDRNQVIHQITREAYDGILKGREVDLPARIIERVKAKITEFGDYVNVPPESWKEHSVTKGGAL